MVSTGYNKVNSLITEVGKGMKLNKTLFNVYSVVKLLCINSPKKFYRFFKFYYVMFQV